jgi:hypothetical protein
MNPLKEFVSVMRGRTSKHHLEQLLYRPRIFVAVYLNYENELPRL